MARHFSVPPNRTYGFALIEVMIAVIVLAAGLLALTALQGALIRSSADSKTRSLIAAYAQSEMDRIRLGGVDAAAGSSSTVTGDFAGVSSITRTVAVTQYVANASGAFVQDASAPGNRAYFKRVTLTLGWTDATTQPRSLVFSTDISPLALNASKVMVDRTPPDDAGLVPIVRRVSPVTEGMIPIATGGGDGEQTAATNPKPKLLGGEKGNYVSDTRFDVLTFSADAYTPDGFAKLNKRIETAIVGCSCQNNTAGFTGQGPGSAYTSFAGLKAYRPTYWDGTVYAEPAGANYEVTSSPVDVSQSELCDVCCRDHKDPVNVSGPKFSPWDGQIATHYKVGASGLVEATGATDQYLEACRVIRVNGVFRVAADPKVQDIALVATRVAPPSNTSGSQLIGVSNNNSATSPSLSDQGVDAYESYVYGEVNSMFFSSSGVAAQGNGLVAQSDEQNLPAFVPILPSGDRRWMHARAFVTDYLESAARARLRKASEDCNATNAIGRAQCVLPYAPMATTNITEIAAWMSRAKTDSDSVPASLVNVDGAYLNFAKAYINRHNSGLALVSAINPNDEANPAQDEQLFVQLSANSPSQSPWLAVPNPNPNTARYFGDPLNPMRGYAETSAPVRFNLVWSFPSGNPGSPVVDSDKNNDPSALVVDSTVCNPGGATNTSNPYICATTNTDNFGLQLAGYNRKELVRINNPCGSGKVYKPVCVVYTFNGATVNSPTGSVSADSAQLVNGTTGKLDEVIQIRVPRVNVSTQSTVTVDFTRTTQEPIYTCPETGTEPVWSVPCQQ